MEKKKRCTVESLWTTLAQTSGTNTRSQWQQRKNPKRHVWTQPSAAPKRALFTWRFRPGREKSGSPPRRRVKPRQPDGAASFDRSHREPTNSSEWSWPGVRSPPSLAWGPTEADSLAREERRRSEWESFNSFYPSCSTRCMHSKGIQFTGRNGRLKNLSSQICIVTITHGDREIYSRSWQTMCY